MKIIADDKIPFLKGVLEPFADVVYVTGNKISHDVIKDADALLIRTRTKCNEELLKDTAIKFIGTATIGFDHIDTKWCESQGIVWTNAPGCNAASVNQYIAATLLNLAEQMNFSLKDRVLGVVGVGNVGSKVVHTAEMLGMRVYLCDPPRVRTGGACGFISLNGILRECDILTFHVPLLMKGQDKTYHMINNKLLDTLNPGTIVINSSRGEVADSAALKSALQDGRISALVLDVWENEPDIDLGLLNLCFQATPHIAGYSVDGKANGTAMIIRELSRHFELCKEDWEPEFIPGPDKPGITIDCTGLTQDEILRRAIFHTYPVKEDDIRLRQHPGDFEKQRGEYPPRREFKAFTLELLHSEKEIRRICRKIGFNVK
jgi:erythronate-4-phosphate dehydrogenase